MQAMVAQHKISKQQEYGFEIQYTAQLHDQERQRLAAMLADDNLTVEQKTRIYIQLLELDARYTAQVEADSAKIAEAQQRAAADSQAAWDKVLQPLTSSFDTPRSRGLFRVPRHCSRHCSGRFRACCSTR
jgi:hypothetical protein